MDTVINIEELVIKAKNGDKKAENQLFAHLHARFLPIVQHRIYNHDKDFNEIKKDAEDIIQQTMETIYKKYVYGDFKNGFLPWASVVLRNKIGDYLTDKKTKLHKLKPFNECEHRDNRHLEEDLIGKDLEGNIINEIKKLSSEYQTIILMLLKGYTTGEIIDITENVSRGTLDSKIHRCRERLKSILRKGGLLE